MFRKKFLQTETGWKHTYGLLFTFWIGISTCRGFRVQWLSLSMWGLFSPIELILGAFAKLWNNVLLLHYCKTKHSVCNKWEQQTALFNSLSLHLLLCSSTGGMTSDPHWCFVLKCQLDTKYRRNDVLLCPGCRVHQWLNVHRVLGCICNVTGNGESPFSSCHPNQWEVPALFGSRMIAYLLFKHYSWRFLTVSLHILTQKHMQVTVLLCTCYISSLAVCLLTEGRLDVTKDGLKVLTIEPEDMFGELALLYNCTHTYSVSGSKALCWLLGFILACRYR